MKNPSEICYFVINIGMLLAVVLGKLDMRNMQVILAFMHGMFFACACHSWVHNNRAIIPESSLPYRFVQRDHSGETSMTMNWHH